MDEDRARFLAEWYGAGEAEPSAEQADPAGTGYISSQIPPSRPDGSLAAGDAPRKRRAAVRETDKKRQALRAFFVAFIEICADSLIFARKNGSMMVERKAALTARGIFSFAGISHCGGRGRCPHEKAFVSSRRRAPCGRGRSAESSKRVKGLSVRALRPLLILKAKFESRKSKDNRALY